MVAPTLSPRDLLATVRTIAVVGFSANPLRASREVTAFLVGQGYRCFGVNPGLAGQNIGGVSVVARLADCPEPVDMVDIFRASEQVGAITNDALALPHSPRVMWMQLGVIDHAAKARAEAAGLHVVMNSCPKIVLGGS